MAACKNPESSLNDHFGLYFAQRYPLVNHFQKSYLQVPAILIFFRNLGKLETAVKVWFSVWQIVQNLLQEPSNGEVLKWIQLAPNLTKNKNNHSYPFLLQYFLRTC